LAERLLAARAPADALRALACAGAEERRAHARLAEASWQAAAACSDWAALAALRRAAGAEAYGGAVCATPLAAAAQAALCPGSPLFQPPWGLPGAEQLAAQLASGLGLDAEAAAALHDALRAGVAGRAEPAEEEQPQSVDDMV
jgi:hypothetical protein